MLPKFSVKKPFTILVAVVMIIVLGVISFTGMTTDLLPSLELPYIIVVTTYPGASPEKVEASVTKPLEGMLGTTSGVKNITSTSSENSSMLILEFEQGINMDSATIEMSGNIDLVSAQLPDEVGAPMMMKISPDMLPIMVASVDMDGMDIKEISTFVSEKVLPHFERIDGVASVDASGIVEEQINVTLNQDKIDALNDKVLANVDKELAKAQKELRNGKKEITDGEAKLSTGKAELEAKKGDASAKLAQGSAQLDSAIASLNAILAEETTLTTDKTAFEAEKGAYTQIEAQYSALNAQLAVLPGAPIISILVAMGEENFNAMLAMIPGIPEEMKAALNFSALSQLEQAHQKAVTRISQIDAELNNITTRLTVLAAMKPQLQKGLSEAQSGYEKLEEGKFSAINEITKAEVAMSTAQKELENAKTKIEEGEEKFEESRDAAYKKANLDGIITADMLSNILKAQNFAMPAGYVGTDDKQLVKVGDAYTTSQEISDTFLMNIDIDGVGDVRLRDVADISITDNSAESYAKINGNDGIVLTFQKQSTASTATVSHSVAKTIEKLQNENPGLHITALMDQGDYIDLIIQSVLDNLIMGGILAILVLALFLKDLKPTFIVACSIPLSLMFAITLMYFSGVTLNMISLSGLALGVGMLVDNSIVVIENIYRLRSEGVPAGRAAVKGASQVAGAIFASTLTTVCVFLPIVFTQGISRQLFADMGLTIAYSLIASLIVALTFVPAMGATVLRKTKEKPHKWFDAFVRGYQKVLKFSLKHKATVLISVSILLGLSCYLTATMGLEFMPKMDSTQMSVSLKMPKGTKQADAYNIVDNAMVAISEIEDVETVGAMSGGGGMMMGMGGSQGSSQLSFSSYVLLKENHKLNNAEIAKAIKEKTKDTPCEIEVQESTMNMSALGGSGIEIQLKGLELDKLSKISQQMRDMLSNIEGVEKISQPEDPAKELRVTVNKDKAMKEGLTVAQVYQELASALKNESTATTLSVGAKNLPVVLIKDSQNKITKENLLNYEFKVKDKEGEEKIITLAEIASVADADGVKSISRDNSVRTMSVSASVDENHNIGLVGREIQAKLDEMTLDEGYTAEMKGENESINNSIRDLIYMILLAVAFIYLIMVAQFQSLLSPFIVMFTIPLAFTGGLLALWMAGMPISIISMLGFLVLAGVVVNNGIVFVDYINQLRTEGMEKHEAIINTGVTRVRPVLMTALTTILAMSTMAAGIGAGAQMTQPLAIVTIGGLTYATLLTLVVVPVMYDIFHRKPIKVIDIGDED